MTTRRTEIEEDDHVPWWQRELDLVEEFEEKEYKGRSVSSAQKYLGYDAFDFDFDASDRHGKLNFVSGEVARLINAIRTSGVDRKESSLHIDWAVADGEPGKPTPQGRRVNDPSDDFIVLSPDLVIGSTGRADKTSKPEITDAMGGQALLCATLKRTMSKEAWDQAKMDEGDTSVESRRTQAARAIWEAVETAIAKSKLLADYPGAAGYLKRHQNLTGAEHEDVQGYILQNPDKFESAVLALAWKLTSPKLPVQLTPKLTAAVEQAIKGLAIDAVQPRYRYHQARLAAAWLRSQFPDEPPPPEPPSQPQPQPDSEPEDSGDESEPPPQGGGEGDTPPTEEEKDKPEDSEAEKSGEDEDSDAKPEEGGSDKPDDGEDGESPEGGESKSEDTDTDTDEKEDGKGEDSEEDNSGGDSTEDRKDESSGDEKEGDEKEGDEKSEGSADSDSEGGSAAPDPDPAPPVPDKPIELPTITDGSLFGQIVESSHDNLPEAVEVEEDTTTNDVPRIPPGCACFPHMQVEVEKPEPEHRVEYETIKRTVEPLKRAIASALRFRREKRTSPVHGLLSGELDSGALDRLVIREQHPRVFERMEIESEVEVSIAILVDESGSMNIETRTPDGCERRYESARKVCTALYEALRTVRGVNLMVYSHYTPGLPGEFCLCPRVTKEMRDPAALAMTGARGANADGWAMQATIAELAKAYRESPLKYLFVLSDGQPASMGLKTMRTVVPPGIPHYMWRQYSDNYGDKPAFTHMRNVCEWGKRRHNVETFGIGINGSPDQHDGELMYGKNHFICLPDVMSSARVIASFLSKVTSRTR